MWLTAALFNSIVDERPASLTHVSQLIIGGEALWVPHVLRAQARLPGVQIINGYRTDGVHHLCVLLSDSEAELRTDLDTNRSTNR